ncbi:CU044_2847 family protein [Nocardia fluminea]|uniref:CU044_2847 family protein n=1 Tax=Nocardia fluminea TaxID=134984 RepID=UPI003650A174
MGGIEQVDGPVDVGARGPAPTGKRRSPRDSRGSYAERRAGAARFRPDEVSVEFGVELAVKTGKLTSVLAEGASKASIKLTLTWNGGEALPMNPAAADDDNRGGQPRPS